MAIDADGTVAESRGLSSTLYNRDLAPTQRANRPWKTYNVFTLWASDVHSLGNYAFATGLFALGLGGWPDPAHLRARGAMIFALLNLSGYAGHKLGPKACTMLAGEPSAACSRRRQRGTAGK